MKYFYLSIFATLFTLPLFSQNLESVVQQYLNSYAEESNLSAQDIASWRITDNHISRQSAIHHIYIRQQYQGIDIIGANADLHLFAKEKGNAALSFNSQFIKGAAANIANFNADSQPKLDAVGAIESAAIQLGLRVSSKLQVIKAYNTIAQEVLVSEGGISLEPIPAKLVYQANEKGNLKLAWDISILELNQKNWWSVRVDAENGKILDKDNWIIECNWETSHECSEPHHRHKAPSYYKKVSSSVESTVFTTMAGNYNVYALPVESPSHGSRSIVSNPEDTSASPYGWHDTNGANGAEYTITRGNNVHAQEDRNGNNGTGYSPDGGASLNFNFPIDLTQAPINNQDANITNLFYWNNVIHDVAYRYGFDEISGNFQENNYGKGGAGGDYVLADAQDGSGSNNANFGTPPDGFNPRMQMFLWTSPNPDIDGDLDNGIILHEYGHGISNRLTGGPSTTGCLNNSEQMGEGWSDYFGIMLTMESTDQGTDRRGVGTYALNQATTGNGIRSYPYSTDMAINPHTYSNISGVSVPHGVGSVWCAMLWEMTWALIDEHGFSNNFYQGTGGNNIAMQLVMEGMKLQPCSPGFVDGRDAILKADTALYNGANSCFIWRAFAKRGLGYSASQGSSSSVSDGTQSFDLPPGVNENCTNDPVFSVTANPNKKAACPGVNISFDISVLGFNGYSGTVTISANNLPTGVNAAFGQTTFNTFPSQTTLTISNTNALASGEYTLQLNGTDGTSMKQRSITIEILPSVSAPALQSPSDGDSVFGSVQLLKWAAVSGAESYDLQVATDIGFTNMVVNEGMLNAASFSTPILNNNTTYYWRVRSNSCLVSNYSSPYSFITSSVCGQTFTDSGGPQGNYGNDELQTWVFCPDNQGEAIRIVFSSFNIEPLSNTGCWDHLTVYDGDSTAAPQIGQFCGTSVADAPGGGTVTASGATGCLTFVFDSDVSVTRLGWEAIIHCLECSAPIISKVDVEDESCIGNEDGKVTVTATGVSPLEYVLTPMGGTDLINTTGVFTGLGADTYTLITRFQSDTTCKTSPQPVVVNSELPEIEKVSISEKDCFGDGTATIIINSNLSSGVEYVLTGSGAGVNPLINSSGIFSDLPVGTYSVTVRTPSNINCKSMDSTIIIPGTMPPVAENLEICLKENIGMNEGLSANCGEEICNRIRVAPNKDINAASTTVCDTIAIHGHTDSVAEIYLSLKLQHAWVGDLSATLESPNGTVINLFDRPGHPSSSFGCSQNNLNLVFADTATQTAAVLEATCNPSTTTTTYAIEGAFKPIDLFAGLNGENANGNWKICIYDHFTTLDHGILEEVVLIVNPRKVITTWWDAPTGGNLLHTGAVFNPLESNNNINTNTTGSYSYWAACECINCPSERTQVDFQVSGEYYYEDSDGDGYGNLGSEIVVCKGANPPANYVTNFSDCDDSNSDDYNRQINDNPITAGEYLANSSITSTGMILENTALVTFQAKDSIVLKPGFTIAQNASFIARIDSCGKLSTNVDNFKNEVDTDYYSKVQQTFKQAPIALNVYPNPFNNLAKIEYELKQKEKVSLLVYDSFGRLVKSYINNKQQDAGSYSYLLEGARLNAGLYIVILKREETMISKRLILSK